MSTRLTYLLVIFIWSTTPLAIKLGGDSLHPIAGLCIRIVLAWFLGMIICFATGIVSLQIKKHSLIYFVASLGLFPNMLFIYYAVEYISSGLVALMFGLLPIFTAILSKPILGESEITTQKVIAIIIALIGLACIFYDDAVLKNNAYIGIILMLISNVLFSACVLWLKKLNQRYKLSSFEQTLGAMTYALPGMLITWFFIIGYQPPEFNVVSVTSILYLSIIASLIGFAAYYHILNNMRVETVSIIPLITPVVAMVLGMVVADEVISTAMLLGACCILLSLSIYQNIFYKIITLLRNR